MNRRIDTTVAAGIVAFGSVGASHSTLLGPVSGTGVVLIVNSTLNQDVVISLDNGTTDWALIPTTVSPTPWVLNLGANDGQFSGTVTVKHNGVAPTAGNISASVIRLV